MTQIRPQIRAIALVFFPGWAMPEHFFASLQKHLQTHFPHAQLHQQLSTAAPVVIQNDSVDTIGIGHSYGFVRLLRQPIAWRATVSVCGFTHFRRRCHANMLAFDVLRQAIALSPTAALRGFYRACNLPTELRPSLAVSREILLRELDDLLTCDETLRAPTLALAARDDAIVSAALTQDCFAAQDLRWYDNVGHALGYREASACADAIAQWLTPLLAEQPS